MHRSTAKRLRLVDVWPDDIIVGDVEAPKLLSNLEDTPWDTSLNQYLDMEYFYEHSGDKLISPLVSHYLDDADHPKITGRGQRYIQYLIASKFVPLWEHRWATYVIEYEPLNNFSYTESETETESGSDSSTMTYNTQRSKSGSGSLNSTETTDGETTEEIEYGKEESLEQDSTQTNKNGIFGFNSSVDSVPSDDGEVTVDNNQTVRNSGTDTRSGTNDETVTTAETTTETGSESHTGTDSKAGTNSKTRTRSYTKSGFNGDTTYQKILEEERALWAKDFFQTVFEDLDSLLTLSVYPASPLG